MRNAAPVLAPIPHWTELARTDYWIVERDAVLRVIRLRRTDKPMQDLAGPTAQGPVLQRAMSLYDPATHGVLIDLRAAPLRSDPEFEKRMRTTQQRALAGFARNAVLVATAVGKLQVTRARREGGLDDHAVFLDESEALSFLTRPRAQK